jgi:hypothetical protein
MNSSVPHRQTMSFPQTLFPETNAVVYIVEDVFAGISVKPLHYYSFASILDKCGDGLAQFAYFERFCDGSFKSVLSEFLHYRVIRVSA